MTTTMRNNDKNHDKQQTMTTHPECPASSLTNKDNNHKNDKQTANRQTTSNNKQQTTNNKTTTTNGKQTNNKQQTTSNNKTIIAELIHAECFANCGKQATVDRTC